MTGCQPCPVSLDEKSLWTACAPCVRILLRQRCIRFGVVLSLRLCGPGLVSLSLLMVLLSFKDFYNSCVIRLKNKELALLCIIMWRVWFLRNQVLHGWEKQSWENVVLWSVEYFADLSRAKDKGNVVQVGRSVLRWRPPCEGFYKLNTDAALDSQNQCVGLGMIIGNYCGLVMASSAQKILVNYSSKVAEALAVSRGLGFAIDTGLRPLVVESDALGLVNLINADNLVAAETGLIIGDIKDQPHTPTIVLLRGCQQIVFVPRLANCAAQRLSKLALSVAEDGFWMESCLSCVERLVQDDLPV